MKSSPRPHAVEALLRIHGNAQSKPHSDIVERLLAMYGVVGTYRGSSNTDVALP